MSFTSSVFVGSVFLRIFSLGDADGVFRTLRRSLSFAEDLGTFLLQHPPEKGVPVRFVAVFSAKKKVKVTRMSVVSFFYVDGS